MGLTLTKGMKMSDRANQICYLKYLEKRNDVTTETGPLENFLSSQLVYKSMTLSSKLQDTFCFCISTTETSIADLLR